MSERPLFLNGSDFSLQSFKAAPIRKGRDVKRKSRRWCTSESDQKLIEARVVYASLKIWNGTELKVVLIWSNWRAWILSSSEVVLFKFDLFVMTSAISSMQPLRNYLSMLCAQSFHDRADLNQDRTGFDTRLFRSFIQVPLVLLSAIVSLKAPPTQSQSFKYPIYPVPTI